MDPAHPLGAGFGTGNGQRCGRGVDAGHLEAATGEKQREGPCAAADVHHAVSVELVRDVDVGLQVGPVRVERVIGRREPRMLEDRIGHEDNPS